MKTDLGTGYIIEGFDAGKKSLLYDRILQLGGRQNILYDGKTSEIPEEIAKECVIYDDYSDDYETNKFKGCYRNYPNFKNNGEIIHFSVSVGFNTAKESIQSACNQPYCIIYKQK